jgi:hypothetical protein
MDPKYLPQMADQTSRSRPLVAIGRATRLVFVQIEKNRSASSARRFLDTLHKACPIKITRLLTESGKELSDRLFASR